MIGAFPDLYPDEMLVSGWARYEAWVCYPNRRALLDELFGNKTTPVAFDVPGRLGHFVAALPLEHSAASVEKLLAEHTLLPYYAAFLPQAQQEEVSKRLRDEPGGQLYGQLGLGGRRPLQLPQSWRYCPICVAADRATFGETYWHRIHHAAGVEVCPHHAVWLKNSEIPMWMAPGTVTFPTAESVVDDSGARSVNLSRPGEGQLLRLARAVLWLLEHPGMNAEAFQLKPRATLRLAERELSTYSGHLKQSRIAEAFTEVYSHNILAQIGCVLDGSNGRATWLQHLLQNHSRSTFALHALLLALFCAEDIPEFLALPAKLKPFGDGPWPCLNPACKHDRERCIPVCEVDYNSKGFPRGTFICAACGFLYSRVGPDTKPDDAYRVGTVKAHGPVWEETLRQLWLDPNVTIRHMVAVLRSSWGHLRWKGTQLGFSFPPTGVRGRQRTKTPAPPRQRDAYVDPTARRNEWLEVVRRHPGETVKDLRKRASQTHSWLRYHDREWLLQHTPPRKLSQPRESFMHWEQRDSELVAEIERGYEQLMSRQEVLFQVSATAILTVIRRRGYYKTNRHHLPNTMAALTQLAESSEDFAIRRIWHIAREFQANGQVPRRRVLAERASVDGPSHRDNSRVQAAVDEAHAWLREG